MRTAIQATILLFLLSIAFVSRGQIVINEYLPANITVDINGNNNDDDWIELYNAGSTDVDLQGYGLSDDPTKPFAFRFPRFELEAGEYVVVYASDRTNLYPVDHWEMAVNASTNWRYFAGTSQPDTNWRNLTFNDGSWPSGNGGIGFGDGDDQTTISTSAKSVMMRKTFSISDTSDILKALFYIDYDDGFVAFLNGAEIARANLGVPGDRPSYNDLAISSHEAQMYQGGDPDSFYIDPVYLRSLLRIGPNVLAVEVHNTTPTSNDLTSRPFLFFGMKESGSTFSNPPSWFGNPPEEFFEAKFKLSRNGETIYLTNPLGSTIDQQTYSEMQPDNSWGRKPDGSSNWCLIKNPTPLASNNSSTCYTGYAAAPVFSIGAGFYSSSQWIALVNSTPGGTIRYTTNGNEPTSSSPAYSSPIHLTSSKTIRARVFASGYLPSPIVTNSYIIGDDIDLPVFTITTDSLNLWDYNTGIYVMGPNADPNTPYFGANFWQDWKKPAAIEYYDKDKNRLFSFDAEIKIYGNYSRAKPQKSFEINMKDKYGTSKLNYTFIPDKPSLTETDNLLLRNSGTDWNVTHFRDALMQRVMKNTHTGYLAADPVVLYLNGSYWGVYQLDENHDHHWIKNNYGLDDDEIDYMKEHGSTIEVKEGSSDMFWTAYNFATQNSANGSGYYSTLSGYWDLENLKDYFIAETYYNNGDWIGDWTNNIKIWRPKAAGGKLRYLMYDLDFGLGYTGSWQDNRLAIAINPTATSYSSNLFDALLGNSQFKREFINRYADLINTIFKPSNMLPVLHQFQDSMEHDMVAHFSKWGSTVNNWHSKINVATSFINNRPAKARDQIEAQFNLNGQVTLTFQASPAGAGRIQVSTIIPESLPWTGVYFNGNPVTITAIPNPGYTFDRWNSSHAINNDHSQSVAYNFTHASETITAYFSGSAAPAQLCVSEFNYNSDGSLNAHDWIELHNYGSVPLNLSGWQLRDQNDFDSFIFPIGTVIPANGYLVVASDLTAFNTIYPSVSNVIGPLGFNLSNGGDQIRILDNNGQVFYSFYYQDISPWPLSADGGGYTCELIANTADPNDGNNWFAGCLGGSPGRVYTPALSTPTHVSGNSTFCPGGQTILSVNVTPGYTYQWRRNNTDISGATDSTFLATQAGQYTVAVLNQGCTGISDTLVVSIVSSGLPPVATSASRCGDGPVVLTATATDSIYWFDVPGGNIVGTGPTFTTPTLSSTTTYYAQASLSCPSTTVPVIAGVNQITATPVANDASRCGPGPVVLNATDTATVHWYNDPVAGALIHTGNIFVTGYIPHDTTYYVEAGSLCPSERIPVNVVVTSSAPPVVGTASRCGPGTLVLTASAFAPIFWYDSIVAGNQVGSGVNFLTPSLTDTKTFYAESNNGCASARVPAIAMINPVPTVPVASDSTLCGSGSVSLYATSNFQVFWYDVPSGGTSLGFGSNFMTPNISSTTTYYAESFDVCASARIPVQAIIEPVPASPVGNDAILCSSGSALLSATASDPIYWFSQATGGNVLGLGNTYTTPILTQTTTFYAVAINGCSSLVTPVTAHVTLIPSSFLGNDTSILTGSTLVLDAGPGYSSYNWSTGATTRTITISTTGMYSVDVIKNGCPGHDDIFVNVVTGISENSVWNNILSAFPNPVKEKLFIRMESPVPVEATLFLTDITGREVFSKNLKLRTDINSDSFDVTGLAKGVYMLTIQSDRFLKTIPITIE